MINNYALAARLRRIATRIEMIVSWMERFVKAVSFLSPQFIALRREIKALRKIADEIVPPNKVN